MRLTKNLLYQYCAVKYGTPLPEEGIWHMDDVIRPEENCDPYLEISKDISMLGETQILTPKPETKHFDFWEDGHMKKRWQYQIQNCYGSKGFDAVLLQL